VLDLAAVMSSYLGRTGSNLRTVLDYAKDIECVLLLDELDAIAKRRDDAGEIGELKRLVTVLIQEIDDWPSSGLLVAATNHPELLDPAIWRRFEMVLDFPIPDVPALTRFIHLLLRDRVEHLDGWSRALALCLVGRSFSDVESELISVRRATALEGTDLGDALAGMLRSIPESKAERIELATVLSDEKLMSQRRACELTGVARDTVRSRLSRTMRTDGTAIA
jgi:SpoVK/Ycf46/Vps4 family AAA+-type ATPase